MEEEEEPSLKGPIEALEDVIEETEVVPTDRQEAIADVLKDQGADDTAADKVGAWADKLVSDAEKTAPVETKVPPPVSAGVTFHIRRADSGCYYNVRKIDEDAVCKGTKAARQPRVAVASTAICARPTKKDTLEDRAKWALDAVDLAEKWASWIDKTCKHIEEIAEAKKKGDEGWKADWKKMKQKTQVSSLEYARNRKYLKQSDKLWNEKFIQTKKC